MELWIIMYNFSAMCFPVKVMLPCCGNFLQLLRERYENDKGSIIEKQALKCLLCGPLSRNLCFYYCFLIVKYFKKYSMTYILWLSNALFKIYRSLLNISKINHDTIWKNCAKIMLYLTMIKLDVVDNPIRR